MEKSHKSSTYAETLESIIRARISYKQKAKALTYREIAKHVGVSAPYIHQVFSTGQGSPAVLRKIRAWWVRCQEEQTTDQ